MKNMTLLLLALACTGCAARASMGEPFQHETHTIVTPDRGRVILFHSPTHPDVQYHRIRIDGGAREKLVAGGFLAYDLPAGQHTIHARQSVTAGVVAVGVLLAADQLFDYYADNETSIGVDAGKVVYLEVRNAAGDRRHECYANKDEAQICTDTSIRPQFRQVDDAVALANLQHLTEIRQ